MQIDYSERGSGRPLILLHGFCETQWIWESFASAIPHGIHVIMPDLPGFGKSQKPRQESFSLDDIGEIMLEWIITLRIERPVVIGHSLGGYVALSMARQAPLMFSGIGLFHSTAAPDAPEKKENRDKAIAFVQKHGVEPYTDAFIPGLFYNSRNPWIPEAKRKAAVTPADTLTGYAAAMRDRASSMELIKEFRSPILFLGGEYDPLITPKHLEEVAETALNPVYHLLKNSAHMGMLENEEDAVNSVKNFMNLTQVMGAV